MVYACNLLHHFVPTGPSTKGSWLRRITQLFSRYSWKWKEERATRDGAVVLEADALDLLAFGRMPSSSEIRFRDVEKIS